MASPDATSAMAQSLSLTASLLASGKYSDLTITCGGKTFNVHRAVVCLQSKPISAMIDGKFKEAVSGVVDLPNDDADVIEKMIEYMYHGNFNDGRSMDSGTVASTPMEGQFVAKGKKNKKSKQPGKSTAVVIPSSPESAPALLLNARMYIVAHVYDVPNLKELAKNKYQELVSTEWNSPSFVTSLKLIYENTPESDRLLKDVAITAAAAHVRELVDRGEFVSLCKEIGEIAFDVLKASCASRISLPVAPDLPGRYCGHCGYSDSIANDCFTG